MRRFTESQVPASLRLQVRYDKRGHWITHCRLFDAETDELLSFGQARCSTKDNPNRKIGRAIAIGRALKRYYKNVADGVVPCPT